MLQHFYILATSRVKFPSNQRMIFLRELSRFDRIPCSNRAATHGQDRWRDSHLKFNRQKEIARWTGEEERENNSQTRRVNSNAVEWEKRASIDRNAKIHRNDGNLRCRIVTRGSRTIVHFIHEYEIRRSSVASLRDSKTWLKGWCQYLRTSVHVHGAGRFEPSNSTLDCECILSRLMLGK